jgi:ribosomal protein S6--L-glutamate ligase
VIKEVGGTPCVIKLLEGTQGRGVILAETAASAKSIIEAFSAANMNILVQEYIKEAGGNDIRVLVVGGKVVASMMRSGKMGEFRANLHRGGQAETVVISEDEGRTAVRSAEVLGLNVAGVDLLRSNRGPMVVEVNSSPGIEGMEQASGADVGRRHDRVPGAPRQARRDQDPRRWDEWIPSPHASSGMGRGLG